MAEGQEFAARLLRQQAERVERLFAELGGGSDAPAQMLPPAIQELRAVIAVLDVVRDQLVLQEATLAELLDGAAKHNGRA